jgi:hypothetical protein
LTGCGKIAIRVCLPAVESIGDLHQFGRREPEYFDLACETRFSVNRQKPGSWAALVGAKVGANVHSHQAMPGDVQPALPQVNGTPGDMGLRQATGWS